MTYRTMPYSLDDVQVGKFHAQCWVQYCMQALIFIWLKNGGKYSAFDLHQQFLPADHPFRGDKKNFTKGRVVHEVKKFQHFRVQMFLLSMLLSCLPKAKPKAK